MLINIGAEFGTHLETSDIAIELMDILNRIPEEEFILDFKDVIFITMNFAQAYYTAKLDCDKKVSEINFSDNVKMTMGSADEAVNP